MLQPTVTLPVPSANQSDTETAEPYYPESDGKPMAETDTHRDLMTNVLIVPLQIRYQQVENVYVTGNILLYYEEGNPQSVISPDVFVVFDLPKAHRRTYKTWLEGKVPDVIFELTSTSTRLRDLTEKRYLYEELGVSEYFIFDPLQEYLKPPLRGFVLQDGFFSNIKVSQRADGEYQLFSERLGLEIHTAGNLLRLYDPLTKGYLPYGTEEGLARQQAQKQAEREKMVRQQAQKQAEREKMARQQAEIRVRQAEAELLTEQLARQELEKRLAEMAVEIARLQGG